MISSLPRREFAQRRKSLFRFVLHETFTLYPAEFRIFPDSRLIPQCHIGFVYLFNSCGCFVFLCTEARALSKVYDHVPVSLFNYSWVLMTDSTYRFHNNKLVCEYLTVSWLRPLVLNRAIHVIDQEEDSEGGPLPMCPFFCSLLFICTSPSYRMLCIVECHHQLPVLD